MITSIRLPNECFNNGRGMINWFLSYHTTAKKRFSDTNWTKLFRNILVELDQDGRKIQGTFDLK